MATRTAAQNNKITNSASSTKKKTTTTTGSINRDYDDDPYIQAYREKLQTKNTAGGNADGKVQIKTTTGTPYRSAAEVTYVDSNTYKAVHPQYYDASGNTNAGSKRININTGGKPVTVEAGKKSTGKFSLPELSTGKLEYDPNTGMLAYTHKDKELTLTDVRNALKAAPRGTKMYATEIGKKYLEQQKNGVKDTTDYVSIEDYKALLKDYDEQIKEAQKEADRKKNLDAAAIRKRLDEIDIQLSTMYKDGGYNVGAKGQKKAVTESYQTRNDIINQLRMERQSLLTDLQYAEAVKTENTYKSLSNNADFVTKADEGKRAFESGSMLPEFEQLRKKEIEETGGTVNMNKAFNYWQGPELSKYTEEEKKTFYYLYATDKDEAEKYWQYMNRKYAEEEEQRKIKETYDWAVSLGDNNIVPTAIAYGTGLVQGLDYIGDALDYAAYGRIKPSFDLTDINETMQSAALANIDARFTIAGKEIDANSAVRFLYGTGLSILNSRTLVGALGKYASIPMALSSASSATKSALAKGATDQQAITIGFWEGVAEAAFEEISIEHLLNAPNYATATKKELIRFALEQAAVEASEEVNTTLANTISDAIVMGNLSDYNVSYNEYRAKGLTMEEARKKAQADWLSGIILDALGGFISGGVMAGVPTAFEIATRSGANQQLKQQAKYLVDTMSSDEKSAENLQKVLDEGLNAEEGSHTKALADEIANKQKAGETVSKESYYALTESIIQDGNLEDIRSGMEYVQAITGENMEQEVSPASVAALDKVQSGQLLTNEEKAALDSDPVAQRYYEATTGREYKTGEAMTQERYNEVLGIKNEEKKTGPVEMGTAEEIREDYSEQYGKELAGLMANDILEGKQEIASFANSYNEVYELAKAGAPLENIQKAMKGSVLTPYQVQRAYTFGRGKRTLAQQQYQNNAGKVRAKNPNAGRVTVRSGLTLDQLRTAYGRKFAEATGRKQSEAYKLWDQNIRAIQELAKILQYEIRLTDEGVETNKNGRRVFAGANGQFGSAEPGVIEVSVTAGMVFEDDMGNLANHVMVQTLAHELVHAGRFWAKKDFDALQNLVFKYIDKNGGNIRDLVDEQMLIAKENGNPISRDVAAEEVVAQAMTDMLLDERVVNDMAEQLANENPSLIEKIVKAIDNFIARIKAFMKGNSYKEAQLAKIDVDGMLQYAEDLRKAFADMTVTASRNMQAAKEADAMQENEAEDLKFSLREPVEETKDLIAVHNLTEDKLLESLKLGGLPMPSIAIVKAKQGHSKFGDISLVFLKETVDPRIDSANRVYGGDAYTPTVPKIGYKIDYDVMESIRDKLHSIFDDETYNSLHFHIDTSNITDALERNGGDFKKAYGRDRGMRLAFLKDIGKELKIPKKDVKYTVDVPALRSIIKKFDVDSLYEIGYQGFEQNEPEVRKALFDYTVTSKDQTVLDNGRTVAQVTADIIYGKELPFSYYYNVIEDARKIKRNGVEREIDIARLDKRIDAYFKSKKTQSDYEAWLDDLSRGIVAKKGIRNNADPYTRIGNRRSFEALYYEYTLENIVRAMKEGQEERGGHTVGVSAESLRSVTSPYYNSIEEIKADSGRLGRYNEETYEAIKKEIDDQLMDVVDTIYNTTNHWSDNRFIEYDSIAEAIINSAKRGKTVNDIVSSFKRDGYSISIDAAQRLKDLYLRSANIPTEYFEAKPRRAVLFDEVATAIIPDNASQKLKNALAENNVPVKTYKAGNEESRLNALNALNNVMFQQRDADYMAAVNSGDMETAQRMVDERAAEEGYNIKVYHGTANGGHFTIFDPAKLSNSSLSSHVGQGFYFTNNKDLAKGYTKNMDIYGRLSKGKNPYLFEGYLKLKNPLEISEYSHSIGVDTIKNILSNGDYEWFFNSEIPFVLNGKTVLGEKLTKDKVNSMSRSERIDAFAMYLNQYGDMAVLQNLVKAYTEGNQGKLLDSMERNLERDGIIWDMKNGNIQYVAFNSNQFKESAPVTYDDEGKVIPLSERFNEGNEDIRYQIREEFYKEFDEWDGKDSNVQFVVGTTSEAMKSVGIKDQEIVLRSGTVISKINKHPEITREIFKKIPELLEDPIIIQFSDAINPKTKKPKYDSRITVLGELYADMDVDGEMKREPVLVSIELLPSNQSKTMVLDFSLITSAYGHAQLQQYLRENTILYINEDKKRTNNWLSLNRLQLPVGENQYGSIRRIAYVNGKVKVQNSNNATYFQKLFEKSGIVDEYGEAIDNDSQTLNRQYRSSSMPSDIDILIEASEDVRNNKAGNFSQKEINALNTVYDRLQKIKSLREKRAEYREKLNKAMAKENPDRVEVNDLSAYVRAYSSQIADQENYVLKLAGENVPATKSVLKTARQNAVSTAVQAEKAKSNALATALRKTRDEKVAEAEARGRERLREYREDRNEKAMRDKYKASIARRTKTLTDWMLKNSDKEHVPEILKKQISDLVGNIDQLSGRDTPTIKDRKFLSSLRALSETMEKNVEAIKGEDENNGVDYYLDVDPAIRDEMKNLVKDITDLVENTGNSFTIRDMTGEQLKSLDNVLKAVIHGVRNVNRLYSVGHYASVVEASHDTVTELSEMSKKEKVNGKIGDFLEFDIRTPVYAFEKYGAAGSKVFSSILRGWAKFAFNMKALQTFSDGVYTKDDARKYAKERHEVSLSDGHLLNMTMAQFMSFYLTSKREDASENHLLEGGMKKADITEVNPITGFRKVTQDAATYHLTLEDIQEINKVVDSDPRAKEIADKLQHYMATVGAKLGNEVSMARFGYNAFGEENYFPIVSDPGNLITLDPAARENDILRLLNMNFTHSLTPGANNAIVIMDIFDVFTSHMEDMCKYNALALPVLDAIKWYNYNDKTTDMDGNIDIKNVKKSITAVYGKGGNNYFINFIKDINGAFNGGRGYGLMTQFVSNAKVAAVAANLRVALLQGTSYWRAGADLNPKYLAEGIAHIAAHPINSVKELKADAAEMLKYSGMAIWKDFGFFDTNVGQSLNQILKHTDSLYDKAIEKSMYLAELGDKITWIKLWYAVKAEQAAKGYTGEELNRMTGERFDDIIVRTQVVDSTITRSDIMRSKDNAVKQATSFASEPMLSLNILANQLDKINMDVRKGMTYKAAFTKHWKGSSAAVAAVIASNIAAAIRESLMDAIRDDDDDSFLQKYIDALVGESEDDIVKRFYESNIGSDLSVISKIPYLREIPSIILGYDSSNLALTAIEDTNNAVKALMSDSKTGYGKTFAVVKALSSWTGLPISNAVRDAVAFHNTAVQAVGRPDLKLRKTEGKYQQLYYAIDRNDTAKIKEQIKALQDDGTSDSTIKRQITTTYKNEYIVSTEAQRAEIRKAMAATGLYGGANGVIEACNKWLKNK